jgi:hypothetical protein
MAGLGPALVRQLIGTKSIRQTFRVDRCGVTFGPELPLDLRRMLQGDISKADIDLSRSISAR